MYIFTGVLSAVLLSFPCTLPSNTKILFLSNITTMARKHKTTKKQKITGLAEGRTLSLKGLTA